MHYYRRVVHRQSPWTCHIYVSSSETAKWNSTNLDRKQDINVLYQGLCFTGQSEKQDGRPGLWLAETFSTIHLTSQNRIQLSLAGNKISVSSTKFVFFGPIGKTRWPPRPSLAEIFSTSLKPQNGIQQNLTWSKILTSSTMFVFTGKTRFYQVSAFGPIEQTRLPPLPLIGCDIFDFSETAERNSTKLHRKQDLNVLYQICVFRANRKKQDGLPGLWLAETFSTSTLTLQNRI